MKRNELLKRMAAIAKERGRRVELHREGGGHSIYRVTGRAAPIAVPRHAGINELTAKGLFEQVRKLAS